VPFALVIGKREAENNQVSLREHGKGDKGVMSTDEVFELFKSLEIH
jgi:threonyl-tRNA synthetase